MIKVLALSPGELFGGVERQILDVGVRTTATEQVSIRPHVFYEGTLSERLAEAGVDVCRIHSRHRYDPAASRRLADLARSGGYDVVHCHGYRAVITASLAEVAGWPLPPVVKTEHGLPEPIRGRPFERLKSGLNHRLDSWATRRCDATVCYVTEDIRRRHDGAHAGLARHVVPNGIDPLDREKHERPRDLPTDRPVFGVVGRISEVKGLDWLMKAFEHQEMPAAPAVIVLGTGPLAGELTAAAAAAGLEDRFRFLGFRTNIHDYIAHLDALLMPSLHEGLPYTLLEAMSLGKPVLASAVGGLAEVLRDNETGLLFPPRDPAAIARACRRLVEEPDLGPRLGAAAARVQRERYTLDAMLDRYVEIYREAIARRGAAARRG